MEVCGAAFHTRGGVLAATASRFEANTSVPLMCFAGFATTVNPVISVMVSAARIPSVSMRVRYVPLKDTVHLSVYHTHTQEMKLAEDQDA